MVGGVDAGRVIDGIGIDANAGTGCLDSAQLRESEVSALSHHLAAQFSAVDANGVIRLVTYCCVGLGGGLHVRPDTAVPQEINRRQQERVNQFSRREVLNSRIDTESGTHFRRDDHRLGRA